MEHTAFAGVTLLYGDIVRWRVVSVGSGAGNGGLMLFYRPYRPA